MKNNILNYRPSMRCYSYASATKVSAAASAPSYTLTVNGKAIQTSRPELIPFELKGTVLVPLRATAESLGNEVQSKKGVTYVPASFFEPSFNEVVVQEGNVSISAQMSSIQ